MTIVTIFYFFSIFIEKSCLIIRRTHGACRIFVVLFEEQFLRQRASAIVFAHSAK